ncbi:PaaI family thioesterase [Mesobacterium pallidum]|uniref:PaaI family thioesterase n=1 Tax=Mesobacterium pallidum TaxID=2872037 RepID=UPI001EE15C6B|nr:PaaI family thioesterase [Mesobacterium pallidum]
MTTPETISFTNEPDTPPAGYAQIPYGEPETFAGPYYEREADGRFQLGFRVKRRHINHGGFLHGGFIATFCDLQVRPIKLALGLFEFSPTVSIAVDYLESGKLGDWIWMEPELVKQTGKMLFTQAIVMAEDRAIARTNAIYRIMRHDTGAKEPTRPT